MNHLLSQATLLPAIETFSLLLVALALAPGMAHVLEMRSKMALPRDDYRTVQQIYRGWALLGVLVVAELVALGLLAFLLRDETEAFRLAVLALACAAGTQLVFWAWTFPVNRATSNWTRLPDHWPALRRRWESSHAVGAALNLVALLSLMALLLQQLS